MRPRHKAAENLGYRDKDAADLWASMRPRHKAAENAEVIIDDSAPNETLQ